MAVNNIIYSVQRRKRTLTNRQSTATKEKRRATWQKKREVRLALQATQDDRKPADGRKHKRVDPAETVRVENDRQILISALLEYLPP